MSARLEELDFQPTPMGDLTLRRRRDDALGVEIFEVKLGEEYLMSSLFTVAEEALADLGLAAAAQGQAVAAARARAMQAASEERRYRDLVDARARHAGFSGPEFSRLF